MDSLPFAVTIEIFWCPATKPPITAGSEPEGRLLGLISGEQAGGARYRYSTAPVRIESFTSNAALEGDDQSLEGREAPHE